MLSLNLAKRLKLPLSGTYLQLLALMGIVSLTAGSCTTSLNENKNYSLSVEDAIAFFDESVISYDTKSSLDDCCGDFYLGNIIPNWSGHELNRNVLSGVENVETTISTDYKYRVLQSDGKRTRYTNCYQKLVIAQDSEGNQHGVFVMLIIPTNDYDWAHKKNLEKKLSNNGDMKDFSGLKLYCTLDGKLSRVNQYENGQKIGGVYFPGIKTESELISALGWLNIWFSNMTFQRGVRITKSTSGNDIEDDGYIYSDEYCGGMLSGAIISEEVPGSSYETYLSQYLDDLINNDLLYGGGNSDDDDLMDDQSGNDGAGSPITSGDKYQLHIGGKTIEINCEQMIEANRKSLEDALEWLSKIHGAEVLVKKLFEENIKFTIIACNEDTKLIKFKKDKDSATSFALSKPNWDGSIKRYTSTTIYLNCSKINGLAILEELCHTLDYGVAKDRVKGGDLEVGAKIFEIILMFGNQIGFDDFSMYAGGNIADYESIFKFALGYKTVTMKDFKEALVHLGDEYSKMKYSEWDMSLEDYSLEEKEAARTYAHDQYLYYWNMLYENK